MTDDVSARLIALRDHWKAAGKAEEALFVGTGSGAGVAMRAVYEVCAEELDGLITALRQDPRSEHEEEKTLARVDGSKVITGPRATASTD